MAKFPFQKPIKTDNFKDNTEIEWNSRTECMDSQLDDIRIADDAHDVAFVADVVDLSASNDPPGRQHLEGCVLTGRLHLDQRHPTEFTFACRSTHIHRSSSDDIENGLGTDVS